MAGREEGKEFCHSRSEDGVNAPPWGEIRDEVPNQCSIEVQLQATGYECHHGGKRGRVQRDTKQLQSFSPELREDEQPFKESRVNPGVSGTAVHLGASGSGARPGTATFGNFMQVA